MRSYANLVLGIAVAVAAAALIHRLLDLLLLVFGAVVLGVALHGLAQILQRRAYAPARWSLAIAIALIAALLAGTAAWVGDPLAEQLSRLGERLPGAAAALVNWLGQHRAGQLLLQAWEESRDHGLSLPRLIGIAGLTLNALGGIAFVVVMATFLAAAPALYRDGLIRLLPPAWRERAGAALRESGQALRRWMLGQSISMLFVGLTTAAGLWLIGVPLPLAVGLISGLLAFIPFVGAIGGGLLAVLLAFIEGPAIALQVAVLCVAIQQVEGHVLTPLVQRWAVQLPPALTVAATVAFGLVFGFVGVFLATPLLVVTMIFVRRFYVEVFLERRSRQRTNRSQAP